MNWDEIKKEIIDDVAQDVFRESQRKKYEDRFLEQVLSPEKEEVPSINHQLSSVLERIWKNNDLEAIALLRDLISIGTITLFRDRRIDNRKPFGCHGEPIFHYFSLTPGAYKADISVVKQNIGKNDGIRFDVSELGLEKESAWLEIHIASGLIIKHFRNEIILFPQIECKNQNQDIVIGDVVEYTTSFDNKIHYGKVANKDLGTIFLKEFTGFDVNLTECKIHYQDSYSGYNNVLIGIPVTACNLISKNDSHTLEIERAITLRSIWLGPSNADCEKFRKWFSSDAYSIPVYILKQKDTVHHGLPFYIFKEYAEKLANEKTCVKRRAKLPQEYSRDKYGMLIPVPENDDEVLSLGGEVFYQREEWIVEESTLGHIIGDDSRDEYCFTMEGLFDFSGDPVVKMDIAYSMKTGEIIKHYEDLDESVSTHYLVAKNISNTNVPPSGSIVQYFDNNHRSSFAEVNSISRDMVCMTKWNGFTYYKEEVEYCGQDSFCVANNYCIPISACYCVQNVKLNVNQLRKVIRFEKDNELVKAPWCHFCSDKKLDFRIDDIISGLENMRFERPEMIVCWGQFISDSFFIGLNSKVENAVRLSRGWIEELDSFGHEYCAKKISTPDSVDFVRIIDEILMALNVLFFSESDDGY